MDEQPARGGLGGEGSLGSQWQKSSNTSSFCTLNAVLLHIRQALLLLSFTAHPKKEISRIPHLLGQWAHKKISVPRAGLEFKGPLIQAFHLTEEESEALRFVPTSPGVCCRQA